MDDGSAPSAAPLPAPRGGLEGVGQRHRRGALPHRPEPPDWRRIGRGTGREFCWGLLVVNYALCDRVASGALNDQLVSVVCAEAENDAALAHHEVGKLCALAARCACSSPGSQRLPRPEAGPYLRQAPSPVWRPHLRRAVDETPVGRRHPRRFRRAAGTAPPPVPCGDRGTRRPDGRALRPARALPNGPAPRAVAPADAAGLLAQGTSRDGSTAPPPRGGGRDCALDGPPVPAIVQHPQTL